MSGLQVGVQLVPVIVRRCPESGAKSLGGKVKLHDKKLRKFVLGIDSANFLLMAQKLGK